MSELRILRGELPLKNGEVTLQRATSAGGAWELVGTDFEGQTQRTEVGAIDGLLFGDPTDPAGGAGRVVVWRHDTDDLQPTAPDGGDQNLQIDASSAACAIARMVHEETPSGQPLAGLFARKPGVDGLVSLEIPAGTWRLQNVREVFHDRIPVLFGDDAKAVLPEYPVRAEWVSSVVDVPRYEVKRGPQGRPEEVVYHVKLQGLDSTIRRTYGAADLAFLGEADPAAAAFDSFRLLVWPDVPMPSWRFYAVEVGRTYDHDWKSQWKWSLFTRTELGGRSSVAWALKSCDAQSAEDGAALRRALRDLSGEEQRVISEQRPAFIELRNEALRAGGVLKLLEPLGDRSATATGAVELGIDVGTSNTCVSVNAGGGEPFSLDFNQMSGEGWPDEEAASPLIFQKVGSRSGICSTKPWLPGVEGTQAAGNFGPARRLTQLPSLVIAMDTPLFQSGLASASPQNVARALPILDVVVPPLDFVNSFATDEWVARSFSRLKWFNSDDPVPQLFLQKYLASLYLFAGAKLRRTNFRVHLSYPLAFTEADQRNLLHAARSAAAEVARYAGLSVHPNLHADESRCIVARHVPEAQQVLGRSIPLVVVCDIGGGSVDIAAATFTPVEDRGITAENTIVSLGADSVRFGANLLFNRLTEDFGAEAFPPPEYVSAEQRKAYVRERMRRAVRAEGYGAILQRVSESSRERAETYFHLYFMLVREYVARFAAAAIRNPFRLGGAVHRIREAIEQGGAPSHSGFLSGPGAGLPSPQMLAQNLLRLPTTLFVVCTGNGWRSWEALDPGRALGADAPLVRDFGRELADRVRQLVNAPVEGEKPDDLKDAFTSFGMPASRIDIGLRRRHGQTVLKEALADAILLYRGPERDPDNDRVAELSAPNGLTESYLSAGDFFGGGEGSVTPWYVFVGQRRITWGNTIVPDVEPPHGEHSFVQAISVSRGNASPQMPQDITSLGWKLGRAIDLGRLIADDRDDLARVVESRQGSRRARPLIAALYEVSYSQLFDKRWRQT